MELKVMNVVIQTIYAGLRKRWKQLYVKVIDRKNVSLYNDQGTHINAVSDKRYLKRTANDNIQKQNS